MNVEVVEGDLLEVPAEILAVPWDPQRYSWWHRPPKGSVTAALQREAGNEPFRECEEEGALAPGEVRLTGPGRLRRKGVLFLHYQDDQGVVQEEILSASLHRAIALVNHLGFRSIALPVPADVDSDEGIERLQELLEAIASEARAYLLRYRPDPPKRRT